jgi:hypothetical protein
MRVSKILRFREPLVYAVLFLIACLGLLLALAKLYFDVSTAQVDGESQTSQVAVALSIEADIVAFSQQRDLRRGLDGVFCEIDVAWLNPYALQVRVKRGTIMVAGEIVSATDYADVVASNEMWRARIKLQSVRNCEELATRPRVLLAVTPTS